MKVAVGIVRNIAGSILIAKRRQDQYQGGLWEFPGGKIEENENSFQALCRELNEEIGICIISAENFMQTGFNYEDRQIFLDVWLVNDYKGQPKSCENQQLEWLEVKSLNKYDFLSGSMRILERIKNLQDIS